MEGEGGRVGDAHRARRGLLKAQAREDQTHSTARQRDGPADGAEQTLLDEIELRAWEGARGQRQATLSSTCRCSPLAGIAREAQPPARRWAGGRGHGQISNKTCWGCAGCGSSRGGSENAEVRGLELGLGLADEEGQREDEGQGQDEHAQARGQLAEVVRRVGFVDAALGLDIDPEDAQRALHEGEGATGGRVGGLDREGRLHQRAGLRARDGQIALLRTRVGEQRRCGRRVLRLLLRRRR